MPRACNFIKKGTLAQVFSCKFCEIFKNIFLQNISGRLHLYVVINLYSSCCSVSCGRVTCIIFSTNPIYSYLLSLVKVGALTIQRKDWIWRLPRIWNSTIAWSVAINSQTFSLKSPLNRPAVNLSEQALCIAISIWFIRFNFRKIEWAKNVIRVWSKLLSIV